jgi:hypothetical protein
MPDETTLHTLRAALATQLEYVRGQIDEGGAPHPAAFLIMSDGGIEMYVLLFSNMAEKLRIRELMLLAAHAKNAIGLVFIADAWHRRLEHGEARTHADLSQDPKAQECIQTYLCAPGFREFRVYPYERRKPEGIVWLPEPPHDEDRGVMVSEWDPWNNRQPEILPYRRVGR